MDILLEMYPLIPVLGKLPINIIHISEYLLHYCLFTDAINCTERGCDKILCSMNISLFSHFLHQRRSYLVRSLVLCVVWPLMTPKSSRGRAVVGAPETEVNVLSQAAGWLLWGVLLNKCWPLLWIGSQPGRARYLAFMLEAQLLSPCVTTKHATVIFYLKSFVFWTSFWAGGRKNAWHPQSVLGCCVMWEPTL